MKRNTFFSAIFVYLIVGWSSVWGQSPGTANNQLIARGKYIADGVAVCTQCHTPRDNKGDLDESKWLDGASLWLRPAEPAGNWSLRAPRIAGSPDATDEQLVTLLTTGVWKDGKQLLPPMPQFRMSQQDARAIVAYLRSLSPKPQ